MHLARALGPAGGTEQQLLTRIYTLEQQDADLRERLDQQNISARGYEDPLAFYRALFGTGTVLRAGTAGLDAIEGTVSLDSPVGLQRSITEQDGPFMMEQTEKIGSLLNVTVEIVPGQGRVLVNNDPADGRDLSGRGEYGRLRRQ